MTVSFSATAFEPQPASLTISDGPTFDFGLPAVGSLNDKSFTVTNSGDIPATGITASLLTLPFEFLGGNYPGTGGDCGATVDALDNCTIVVRYAPTLAQPAADNLELNYHDGFVNTNLYATTNRRSPDCWKLNCYRGNEF